jgi:hypothetical protein
MRAELAGGTLGEARILREATLREMHSGPQHTGPGRAAGAA